jgi:hypothetical protein
LKGRALFKGRRSDFTDPRDGLQIVWSPFVGQFEEVGGLGLILPSGA